MTAIQRVRVALTDFPGAPGVSTFYAVDGAALEVPLQAMWASLAVGMPSSMKMAVVGGGDIIEDTTGALTGTWIGSATTPAVGADPAGYAGPAGIVATWFTSSVIDGKRLKGRTFIVPLGGGSYQSDGTINPTNLTNITNAIATFQLATAANLLVWHRPRKARAADGSRKAVTARAGGSGVVTSVGLADRAAVLRSRRG